MSPCPMRHSLVVMLKKKGEKEKKEKKKETGKNGRKRRRDEFEVQLGKQEGDYIWSLRGRLHVGNAAVNGLSRGHF